LDRLLYICAGIAGFGGVALGAFAAHGLKARLTPDMLAVFETGARYQMYHALALCAAAWGWARWRNCLFGAAGGCFVAGIVLFSGSLYLLALTNIRALGMITPLGGLGFLAGWTCLAMGAFRGKRAPDQLEL
jgi:uncharacterized membrane protein YgdD (TMEM256/DUF423 family)